MTYGVFLLGRQLGKGFIVAVGHKYGIVTETLGATGRVNNASVYNAFKEPGLAVALNQGDYGAEAGAAVGLILHLLKQEVHIGQSIVPHTGSEPCRMYTGSTVQGINFKTGIVGKAIVTVTILDPTGFLNGIAFQCIGILGNVVVASYIVQGKYSDFISYYTPQFRKLVSVICGKNYFHKKSDNPETGLSDITLFFIIYCVLPHNDVDNLAGHDNHLAHGFAFEPFCG